MSINKKPANQWSIEELLEWAAGELKAGGQTSDRKVASHAIVQFDLEASSNIDSVKLQILDLFPETVVVLAEEPESAEVVEEPEVEVEVTEEPVVEVTEEPEPEVVVEVVEEPVVVVVDESAAPTMPEQDVVVIPTPQVFDQNVMTRDVIENNLANYLKGMGPNVQISAEEGVARQVNLYRTFQIVLRSEGADFFKNMDLLLGFIAAHRDTLFTETRAFRFFQTIRLPASDRKVFERLLNLFIGTAIRETRGAALKQVDMSRTIEGLSAAQQQRVIEYYSV